MRRTKLEMKSGNDYYTDMRDPVCVGGRRLWIGFQTPFEDSKEGPGIVLNDEDVANCLMAFPVVRQQAGDADGIMFSDREQAQKFCEELNKSVSELKHRLWPEMDATMWGGSSLYFEVVEDFG